MEPLVKRYIKSDAIQREEYVIALEDEIKQLTVQRSKQDRIKFKLLETCELAHATITRLDKHGSARGTLDVLEAAPIMAKEEWIEDHS